MGNKRWGTQVGDFWNVQAIEFVDQIFSYERMNYMFNFEILTSVQF